MTVPKIPVLMLAVVAVSTAVADETLESSAESGSVRVDFRTSAVRDIGSLAEILPFAANSSADWIIGGDADKTAVVAVTPMGGADADDPSGWVAAGEAVTLSSAAGETTAAWAPTVKRFYRATLAVDGVISGAVCFDLSAATDGGLTEPKDLATCTIELDAGPYESTGYPQNPILTISDGATVLEAGVDYVFSCTDNINAGTATAHVLGAGDYFGSVTRTFTIVPFTPKAVSTVAPMALSLDTRPVTVRTIPTLGDLHRFAWTSSAGWTAGGDGDAAATLSVSAAVATDPDDPSTWEAAGTPTALVADASGEGTEEWQPEIVGLYLAKLAIGGVETVACLDMRETEGLSAGEPIEGFTVVFDAPSYPCTGYPVFPEVVVSNGEVTLVKDVDYSCTVVNGINAGTATLKVQGIGKYTGAMELAFTIAPSVVTEVTAGAFDGTFPLDSTTNAVCNVARAPFDFFATWNNDASWPIGGVEGDAVARVSVAPLAAPGAEPGEFRVLNEAGGEGQFPDTPHRGYSLYRLEVIKDGVATDVYLRVIKNNLGTMIIVR